MPVDLWSRPPRWHNVDTRKMTLIDIFFFQAEDGIRDSSVTGVQTCALPISSRRRHTRFKCDWSSDVCSSDLHHWRDAHWIFRAGEVPYRSAPSAMGMSCQTAGCKNDTPPALAEQRLCVLHFTLTLESSCSGMRREAAPGNAPQERPRGIMKIISENGECPARVATRGRHLTNDLQARILSTFLTLMHLRGNLD